MKPFARASSLAVNSWADPDLMIRMIKMIRVIKMIMIISRLGDDWVKPWS